MVGWAVGIIFVVFGLGVMAANPANMERPILVGAFTSVGGLIVSFLMWRTQSGNGPFSWWQIFGYLLIALGFFAWGRLIDYMLGPTPVNREADEETMGAHLSD